MDSATSGLESGPRLQERKWYTVDLELRCEDMIMLAIAHRQQFTTAARVLHQEGSPNIPVPLSISVPPPERDRPSRLPTSYPLLSLAHFCLLSRTATSLHKVPGCFAGIHYICPDKDLEEEATVRTAHGKATAPPDQARTCMLSLRHVLVALHDLGRNSAKC